MSYFDYAASTPVSSKVLDDMGSWQNKNFSNASAAHAEGLKASKAIQLAREVIADKIGAMPSEIVFTSGASEANNLAIKGVAFGHLEHKGHIITSSIEHKCIINTCLFLEKIGFDVTYLKPNEFGVISSEQVASSIKPNTLLISIHHVNNELGVVQPIADFGRLAFEHNIPFHTDAAQSFCKLRLDVDDMDIDMLSLSGHKVYGPKGIGALYVRNINDSGLVPQIHGGGQEGGLRGGTSPTSLIVGLASAVKNFPNTYSFSSVDLEKILSNYKYVRNGKNPIDTIFNITFKDDDEVKRFHHDNHWLVSQGSACNAMSNVASHVLTEIGLSDEEARRTYRISLPPYQLY
ncbi:cysteine desulfurase family protein [Oceanisphaera sp. W20_SRM_FM3]|uniref:cysteine desulfurase family protein n=1 Tax=Oceanisphaera sp. W20_SRM_FM3 TaxID=3240267 RepID=UPI003F98A98B